MKKKMHRIRNNRLSIVVDTDLQTYIYEKPARELCIVVSSTSSTCLQGLMPPLQVSSILFYRTP